MLNSLRPWLSLGFRNVPNCRTLRGITLHAILLAVPVILPAQQVCLPQLFQTGAFASLTPSGASHQVLLRQSDGSYTAFEIPDAPPYQALSTTPNFGRQLRNCPNPEPSDVPAPISTGIYERCARSKRRAQAAAPINPASLPS